MHTRTHTYTHIHSLMHTKTSRVTQEVAFQTFLQDEISLKEICECPRYSGEET